MIQAGFAKKQELPKTLFAHQKYNPVFFVEKLDPKSCFSKYKPNFIYLVTKIKIKKSSNGNFVLICSPPSPQWPRRRNDVSTQIYISPFS